MVTSKMSKIMIESLGEGQNAEDYINNPPENPNKVKGEQEHEPAPHQEYPPTHLYKDPSTTYPKMDENSYLPDDEDIHQGKTDIVPEGCPGERLFPNSGKVGIPGCGKGEPNAQHSKMNTNFDANELVESKMNEETCPMGYQNTSIPGFEGHHTPIPGAGKPNPEPHKNEPWHLIPENYQGQQTQDSGTTSGTGAGMAMGGAAGAAGAASANTLKGGFGKGTAAAPSGREGLAGTTKNITTDEANANYGLPSTGFAKSVAAEQRQNPAMPTSTQTGTNTTGQGNYKNMTAATTNTADFAQRPHETGNIPRTQQKHHEGFAADPAKTADFDQRAHEARNAGDMKQRDQQGMTFGTGMHADKSSHEREKPGQKATYTAPAGQESEEAFYTMGGGGMHEQLHHKESSQYTHRKSSGGGYGHQRDGHKEYDPELYRYDSATGKYVPRNEAELNAAGEYIEGDSDSAKKQGKKGSDGIIHKIKNVITNKS
ncbi:hypothetical protein KAFR_0A07680 [Kazachstania africana CBS 2517]|uniref:Uncharacterized protein n=1 Tax=Kazachstania africana (strain ATCC 22294 / BCRC 22015 / CBS 2517 / CECT 1963 / NBRC 1671 / NRRL Y-8276) TaxID=1071382 RepID=H2APA2_KAZAF|nr:hypothetical protein KAFR_0A07680 [Kazachstania africana CBS 2517]CCF56202.1 hypothetical protein KAFR_0A07680 [Kazachstania africana CBS 2517]